MANFTQIGLDYLKHLNLKIEEIFSLVELLQLKDIWSVIRARCWCFVWGHKQKKLRTTGLIFENEFYTVYVYKVLYVHLYSV